MLREYTLRLIAESSAGAITLLEEMQQEGGGGIAENSSTSCSPCCTALQAPPLRVRTRSTVRTAVSARSTATGPRASPCLPRASRPSITAFSSSRAAICTTFLIESNLKALQFLAAIQLQALFAMLVAVCSATAALLDLADLFCGSFCVTAAARQLTALLETLEADLYRAKKEVLN